MTNLLIKLIRVYQKTPLHSHSYCRFIPSCSEYAIIALREHGLFKGLFLSIKRIVRCNPFGTSGIDNVPPKDKLG
jgi:hypothetical protein